MRGDIDILSVAALRTLLATLEGDIEINCEGLAFVDSAGIGLLIAFHNALTKRGHRLMLRELNDTCYWVFEITRLTEFLDIEVASAPA